MRRYYDSEVWEEILQLTSTEDWEFDKKTVDRVQKLYEKIDPNIVESREWSNKHLKGVSVIAVSPKGEEMMFETVRDCSDYIGLSQGQIRVCIRKEKPIVQEKHPLIGWSFRLPEGAYFKKKGRPVYYYEHRKPLCDSTGKPIVKDGKILREHVKPVRYNTVSECARAMGVSDITIKACIDRGGVLSKKDKFGKAFSYEELKDSNELPQRQVTYFIIKDSGISEIRTDEFATKKDLAESYGLSIDRVQNYIDTDQWTDCEGVKYKFYSTNYLTGNDAGRSRKSKTLSPVVEQYFGGK